MPMRNPKYIPALFAVITIVTYGLLLPFMGFYWDDWPFAWIQNFLGPREFIPAFEPFRPFLGPIFFVTTSLLPSDPIWWQALALLLRFALTACAWWVFRSIWPDARWQTLAASLLFLVFPGFSQHWVAYTHINQEIIPFLFYLLSFGFTAGALRQPGRFNRFTVLALFFLLLGVFPTEYFATQEPLRLLFIWVLIADRSSPKTALQSTWKALKLWFPYLLIWIGNAAWLIYYYRFGAYASYNITVAGAITPLDFLTGMADAVWKAGLYSWVQVVALVANTFSNPSTLLTAGVMVVSFLFLAFYLSRLEISKVHKRGWPVEAILIGLVGIMIGRIPSWAAGLPLTLGTIDDRFMFSVMVGGALFTAGVIELLFRGRGLKVWALALVLALGIGQQFYYANEFRRDWARQKDIFWQLAWRVPDLEPGTVILTHELPVKFETDMGLSAPLNWMYAPDYIGGDLPYLLFYTRTRLGRDSLPTLEPATEFQFEYRTVRFRGSTSQALTIVVPSNACLHVIDETYGGGDMYERYGRFLLDAIPLSDLSLIHTDASPPEMPAALFGKEPARTWCYYFEKAELARQIGDWETVVSLGNEARTQGYNTGDMLEWLPFIEGYAVSGDLKSAREISIEAFHDDSRPRKGLCHTWNRILENLGGDEAVTKLANEMLGTFQCAPNSGMN